MQLEIGKIYEGKVTGITKFGAFVELEHGTTGMVHISEVANTYVSEIKDHLTEGQQVKVKVLSVGDAGKISLSIKKAMDNPPPPPQKREFRRNDGNSSDRRPPDRRTWEPKRQPPQQELTFEDMLSKFKQNSEEKQCDLKKIMEGKRGSNPRRGGNSRP
ncbi:MAG: S1 RNA-binding domain-containing protein [Oscillospiraceae bacterium]